MGTKVERMRKRKGSKVRVGVVDFFCGSGGVSAGLKSVRGAAEFHIIEGIDNDAHCASTYERMIGAPCDTSDILMLANDNKALAKKIASWRLDRFDRVLLVGCSPCQGFAAHRKSIVGHDPRRNLVEAFCKIAAKVKPDAILMENVPDLFSADHWRHFAAGQRRLMRSGYEVRAGIYNLAGFGLPKSASEPSLWHFVRRSNFQTRRLVLRVTKRSATQSDICRVLLPAKPIPPIRCMSHRSTVKARLPLFDASPKMEGTDRSAWVQHASTEPERRTVVIRMCMDDSPGIAPR